MDLSNFAGYLSTHLSQDMVIILCCLIPFLMAVFSSRSLFFVCVGFAAYVFNYPIILPAFLAFLFSTFLCLMYRETGKEFRHDLAIGLIPEKFAPLFQQSDKFVHLYFKKHNILYLLFGYFNFTSAQNISFYYFSRETEYRNFGAWNIVCGSIWAMCVSGAGYMIAASTWQRIFIEKQEIVAFSIFLFFVSMLLLQIKKYNSLCLDLISALDECLSCTRSTKQLENTIDDLAKKNTHGKKLL